MVAIIDDFLRWFETIWNHAAYVQHAIETIKNIKTEAKLQEYVDSLPLALKIDPAVNGATIIRRLQVVDIQKDYTEPFTKIVSQFTTDFLSTDINNLDPLALGIDAGLTQWKSIAAGFQNTDPADAQKKLAAMTAKALEIFTASAAIDYTAGLLPDGEGPVSAWNTKHLLTMMGFSAVAMAAFHDPIKIGVLRPYQDNLEATFRNRRPEYVGIINAYRQRSLSEITVTNTDEITDAKMDEIENDNNVKMDEYGAAWGYSEKWIKIEKDAATKAMTFGNLMAMARLGYYNHGLTIFSLWTYGLDRRLMVKADEAIRTSMDVGMWKGFRSMVEPSYVQGMIEEADLKFYWDKILVPPQVQGWALERLTHARDKFAAKELKLETAASKDLTKSDWTQAYERDIISIDEFKTKLATLGYDATEVDILVKLADSKKAGTGTTACKHLPLTDYELAHRNGILTLDQVLAHMQGQYCQSDIDLEKQLLQISDLTSDAPAAERDLSVSKITEVYADNDITKPQLDEYLIKLGFDDQERSWLITLADIKKTATDAKTKGNNGKNGIIKERDLTQAQLSQAYVQNVIDEAAYTADLAGLGYDPAEVAILLKLAQIKKKLPSLEGLKRLPLGDYEKAWKYSQLTADQVLERMRGEYREEDIQLERLLLSIGKP